MRIKNRKVVSIAGAGVFILVLLIVRMRFGIVIVDGESMAATVNDGQIAFVIRDISSLKNGDIIVFDQDKKRTIKRIVASPGDTVDLSDGQVYVNDIVVQPYNYEGSPHTYTLDGNEYFVIGDNYLNSYDSRNYGPITAAQLVGEVIK